MAGKRINLFLPSSQCKNLYCFVVYDMKASSCQAGVAQPWSSCISQAIRPIVVSVTEMNSCLDALHLCLSLGVDASKAC